MNVVINGLYNVMRMDWLMVMVALHAPVAIPAVVFQQMIMVILSV